MPRDPSKKTPKVALEVNDYNVTEEIGNLKAFVTAQGLLLPEDFYSKIEAGDIIEIYSFPQHKQIYANKEFLKHSSYSLEQMTSIPFHKLFWRDLDEQNALMERAIHVATNESHPVRWDLPPHDLIESLHPRKRTFEMHMGWICPVFNQDRSQRVAWASTLRVQYVYEWPEDTEL